MGGGEPEEVLANDGIGAEEFREATRALASVAPPTRGD